MLIGLLLLHLQLAFFLSVDAARLRQDEGRNLFVLLRLLIDAVGYGLGQPRCKVLDRKAEVACR